MSQKKVRSQERRRRQRRGRESTQQRADRLYGEAMDARGAFFPTDFNCCVAAHPLRLCTGDLDLTNLADGSWFAWHEKLRRFRWLPTADGHWIAWKRPRNRDRSGFFKRSRANRVRIRIRRERIRIFDVDGNILDHPRRRARVRIWN